MTLTHKQEKFSQSVASGMTQADAYRAAYNAGKMKAETVHKRASELIANGEVAGRIAALQHELSNKQLWTREMSVKALVAAYKIAQQGNNSGAMTGAVKELNNMHGFNGPEEKDNSVHAVTEIRIVTI